MESSLAYEFEPEEEIIGGKVVMMASPTTNHIFTAGNIYAIFNHYLRGKQCVPFPDGATLFLEDGEEYKPDMMVVCDPEKIYPDGGVRGAPDLVVEVLSPSTGRNDRGRKKDAYERNGVREYWIVSPAEQSVEQYVLENGRFVLRDVCTRCPPFMLSRMKEEEKNALATEFKSPLFDGLTIRLEDVFYRVAFNA
ncbi:MAG: Uma2 family endonuclease [Oscillibacter sp.]|nr:Uma2 family endonuclease [Oscillibacter sp.]